VADFVGQITPLLSGTISNATPLILTAVGAVFSERSGVMNIGLEGMMLISAFAGAVGGYFAGSVWVGLLFALLAGLVFALIHALMCVTFEADQIISGTAINLLALAAPGFIMLIIFGHKGTTPTVPNFNNLSIPLLSRIPFVGPALFDQDAIVYIMYLLIPLAYFVLFKTSFGLRLRATGESPESVDVAGISVSRMRYYGVAISGLMAGLGGLYLSTGLLSAFTENMTGGRGFIALAAMIFGRWHPIGATLAALLFGFAEAVATRYGQGFVPVEFSQMIPYVLTILVLAGVGGRAIPPAAIGRPYRKE